MAENIIKVRQKQRCDTEANWTSKNPVLLAGEIAISSDKNGLMKVGDGKSLWTAIPYSKASLSKTDVTTALGYTPPTANTTYSIGTSSTAGIVKLYTGTGSNTDGSMTQAAITSNLDGKAPKTHTHSQYYDSTISRAANTVLAAPNGVDGGATFRKLVSADLPAHGTHIPDNCKTITDWNNATTNGWYMYADAKNAPATGWLYGIVIAHNTNYVRQILYRFANTSDVTATASDRYERVKQNGTWGSWVNTSVRKAVPLDAKFTDTNTWRGIQNNLTSDSTTDSLSAAQGKALKALVDGKSASGHTHNYAGSASAGGAANNSLLLDGVALSSGTNLYNKVAYIGSDGVLEAGRYFDMHFSNKENYDFTTRLNLLNEYGTLVIRPRASTTCLSLDGVGNSSYIHFSGNGTSLGYIGLDNKDGSLIRYTSGNKSYKIHDTSSITYGTAAPTAAASVGDIYIQIS